MKNKVFNLEKTTIAKKFDLAFKEKIDDKHAPLNYIYTMSNTIEDKYKLADKLDADDKLTIQDTITETENWLALTRMSIRKPSRRK